MSEVAGRLRLVAFGVGDEKFGAEILRVQEINKVTNATRVPEAPEFLKGIIDLLGKVIPVTDLRKSLGIESKEDNERTRIFIADREGKTIGFKVDAVNEVLKIPSDKFDRPPEIATGTRSDFFKLVAKLGDKLLILLDLDKILAGSAPSELSENM